MLRTSAGRLQPSHFIREASHPHRFYGCIAGDTRSPGRSRELLALGSLPDATEGYRLRVEAWRRRHRGQRRAWRAVRHRPSAARAADEPEGRVHLPDRSQRHDRARLPLRGHQLGYRAKTNSYDGWDLPQWEQYLRDLAVFGANAIEMIPPRSDDDADSPHFPRPPMEMMAGMSQLADEYGLDVWLWYPAMDEDYSDAGDGRVRPEGVGRGLRDAAAP